MKGIMRKRLLALLSAAGLAGTAASSAGQSITGPQPGNKTKAESSLKSSKAQQENKAGASAAAYKEQKAAAEKQAAKDVVTEKLGADQTAQKHLAGVKYEDAASKDAAKMTKAAQESKAGAHAADYREQKASSENRAAKDVVNEKMTIKQNADAASKDAAKMTKAAQESKAAAGAADYKENKAGAQRDFVIKGNNANARQQYLKSEKSNAEILGTRNEAGTLKQTKAAAESKAAKSEADKKVKQAPALPAVKK